MIYEVIFHNGSRVKIEAENPEYAGILASAEQVKKNYRGSALQVKSVVSKYIVEPVMFNDEQGYANVYETENGRIYISGECTIA